MANPVFGRILRYLLGIAALIYIGLAILLFSNHLFFPLNLEAMETTVLEHVRLAFHGQPIYTTPTAHFTALAYNPLYYYLCAGVAKLAGIAPSLVELRLITLAGTLGCGLLVFRIVQKETRSFWWGWMALGLFAASYQALDSYLDVAHRDSWLLLLVLAGYYLIGYSESRLRDAAGVALVFASFWMKQQGAVFGFGSLVFLFLRDLRRGNRQWHSWPAYVTGVALGPALYVFAPQILFGPEFHYFTWIVPRHWTEITRDEIREAARLLARRFAVPAACSGIGLQFALERQRPMNIWIFALPVAFGSAVMSMLTPGSNLNVYIPFGVWLLLTAAITLPRLAREYRWPQRVHLPEFALVAMFGLLLYNPKPLLVSGQGAEAAYLDLNQFLGELKAPVYTPVLGPLPGGPNEPIAAHWVPLEDIMRGPGAKPGDAERVKAMLTPVAVASHGYLLHNRPLETDNVLQFLTQYYVLDRDLGDRFKSLDCIPRRYTGGYPRYLYRYDPDTALRLSASGKRP